MSRAPAALALAIAAMAAVSLAGDRDTWVLLAAHGIFLGSLAVAIGAIVPGIFRRRLLLPLALLYALTFSIDRQALTHLDYVFNSDSARYLDEARSGRIQVRHLGFPAVTFPPAALARTLGLPALGREAAIAETALAGALLVAGCGALVARLGISRRRTAGIEALLASSLAIWSLSSMVETFAWSALCLVLALHAVASWAEAPSLPRAAAIGLVWLLALGFSLENAYLAVVLAAGFGAGALSPGRALRHAAIAFAIPLAGLAAWVPLVAKTQGPGFFATWGDQKFERPADGVAQNLHHFTAEYLDLGRLSDPRAHLETAWRVGVMSVRGQPGEAPERYPLFVSRESALRPLNLAYLGLAALLSVLALPGALRLLASERGATRALAASAWAVLVARHLFTTAYAPTQSLLFAPPSLVAGAVLLGAGLWRGTEENLAPRRNRAGTIALWLLVALLATTNGYTLVEVQTRPDAPWRNESVSPTAIR